MSRDVEAPVGVVLAGGASTRLGRDKATLRLADAASPEGGETLVARAVRALAAVCDDVVVADRGRGLVPGRPSVDDGAGAGPAAGLLGAASARPGRPLLVLACDLPAVDAALLRRLLDGARERPDAAWVVPRVGGRLEPLCALYRPAILAALDAAVRQGRYALHTLADDPRLEVAELAEDRFADLGEPRTLFFNLNSPEDLALSSRLGNGAVRLAPPGERG